MPSEDRFEHGENVRERAFRFGCRIIRFCERLDAIGGMARAMMPQLLRAGTALYPMLEEARAAESTRDFISKCMIGLKEVREALGRLRYHVECRIGPPADAQELKAEANELISIVTTIVANTREKTGGAQRKRARRIYDKIVPDSQFPILNS